MNNIFWDIYINLEREVLNLAEMVHFTDNQLSVYSVRISDLLVRCNVEAESLIRELYKKNTGKSLSKIGEMLNALNNDWQLEKKQVSIISSKMHYSSEYASFCPYYYNNKDSNDFYSAYNAIKHDRASNFERYATIHFLLRALGALFLLNIYYRQEAFQLQKTRTLLDSSLGSRLFAFKTKVLNPKYPSKELTLSSEEELRALYIIKPLRNTYHEYYHEFDKVFARQKEALRTAGYLPQKDEDGKDQDISYDEVYRIAASIGGADLVKRISEIEQPANKKYLELPFEAILNKFRIVHYLGNNEEEPYNE